MNELGRLIQAKISEGGPLRFDRFMDLALYHPEHGYYRRERATPRTGREGDFFTSVSVGPLFGHLLARQFVEMWEALERPTPFWIMEQGAEDGQLVCDILEGCRLASPVFFEVVRYAVVESSGAGRAAQQKAIASAQLNEKVEWFENLESVAEQNPTGVFVSNELVDAFPVRRITYKNGTWRELHVAFQNENFTDVDGPIEDRELIEEMALRPLLPIEGYTTEIHARAREWMKAVGRILKRGYVLTLDYGFPASLYYAPFRVNGTLTAYRAHQRTEDVLTGPGSRDITAHVDFTALALAGEKAGLATLGFLDQQHFLMGIAHDELSGGAAGAGEIAAKVRAWQTLIHPGYLGTRFHALLQARDAPANLAGLRYARPGGLD